MVTTSWITTSGDWNDPQNWSYGVPTANDSAVLPQINGAYTITGDGPAASLVLRGGDWRLHGQHTIGTLTQPASRFGPDPGGLLNIQSGTLTGSAILTLGAASTVSGGSLTFVDGEIDGGGGLVSNPLVLSGEVMIGVFGTLSGQIAGAGSLVIGGPGFYQNSGTHALVTVLANPRNTYSGGTYIESGVALDVATPGALGTGPVRIDSGALIIDSGTLTGTVQAGPFGLASVRAAAAADLTVFAGHSVVNYSQASGAATIIGSNGAATAPSSEDAPSYGRLVVNGGGGRVTVFGADEGGSIYGGSAGHNVIVAGAPFADPLAMLFGHGPFPVTVGGGGDGDLLVITGAQNNLFAAASGNETLTGTAATGNNTYFGGTGADVIAAGLGSDQVFAGSGPETISAGSAGFTRIFLGPGPAVVLGGGGVDSVQVGRGVATVYAGAGYDRIGVANGQSGGAVVVAGFKLGIDQIAPTGYSSPPAVATTSAGTVLTFSDNSNITLLGVGQLASNTVLTG